MSLGVIIPTLLVVSTCMTIEVCECNSSIGVKVEDEQYCDSPSMSFATTNGCISISISISIYICISIAPMAASRVTLDASADSDM